MGCALSTECEGCPHGDEFGCEEHQWNPSGRRDDHDSDWDFAEPYDVSREDSRLATIVEWLSESKFARDFKRGKGFFVAKGPHVRLQGGTIIDLFDWLFEEGIVGGSTVAGYSVAYAGPETKYGERLSFFKVDEVVDAPFSRLSSEALSESFEDDIA